MDKFYTWLNTNFALKMAVLTFDEVFFSHITANSNT